MRKRLLPILLAALPLLSGCVQAPAEDGKLRILATTYPAYLFTTSLTDGIADVEVSLLVNSRTSCLHDYTLTVENMKDIERADVIVMNGAGLEAFMADALSRSDAAVIDCSEGLGLLPAAERREQGGHDHGEEYDPHFWMDPALAGQAVETVARKLALLDDSHAADYGRAAVLTGDALRELSDLCRMRFAPVVTPGGEGGLPGVPGFLSFHDGFQYFADFSGLTLLGAIEEEDGSVASASELKELIALLKERDIPAVFVEKNGSRSTAELIARETGCGIYELDLLMSGGGTGIQPYLNAMTANQNTVAEAFHEYSHPQ